MAIPARNEQASISECVASIDVAAGNVDVPVQIVVAADICNDRTTERALGTPLVAASLTVLEGRWGRAGAARAAAVAYALEHDSRAIDTLWVANTDADTVVPSDWLERQFALGHEYSAVAGIVALDATRTCPNVYAGFASSYQLDGDTHPHVHGANLGVRGDIYAEIGGWCPTVTVGEDHGLWERLLLAGVPVIQTTALHVSTSARIHSRVEGGFATNLRALATAALDPHTV